MTIDVSRAPRDEAIRKLAEAAGWSVVVHAPQADLVDVHVKDQPASKVLDLLLLDASYVATRDGSLVSIRRTKAEAAGDEPKDDDGPKDDEPGARPARVLHESAASLSTRYFFSRASIRSASSSVGV